MAATRIGFWTWIWSMRHCGLGQAMACWSMLEKLNWFRLIGLITLVLMIRKRIGLFLRKNHLLKCRGWLSLLNWIRTVTLSLLLKLPPRNSYIISIAKTASKKIGALIHSMKCLSSKVALSLNKFTKHVWNTVSSCFLELLDELQKWVCRSVSPSLAAFLEPLTHRWNVVVLSLLYKYYSGKCSSELAQLLLLPHSWGSSTRYSDNCMIFLLPFLDITRMFRSTISFLAQLDSNSLPMECFTLTYDLNGFKSRIKVHLLIVASFLTDF